FYDGRGRQAWFARCGRIPVDRGGAVSLEVLTKFTWGLIAAVHLMPSLTAFAPNLVQRLYGVTPDGDVGVLLVHRGALFAAVVASACFAVVHAESRRLASVVAVISMVSFLLIYARAGFPVGDLRKIAVVDFIGLGPLLWVFWRAWW
ncbi:MAG: hypothetical protein AAFV29_09150, partial [Myxococcota bacterium]